MSAKRKQLFPPPAHMAQCEAIDYLRRQVFDDAVKVGWLKPCTRKDGKGSTVFYNFEQVRDVSLRIAAGDYPKPKEEAA